MTIEQMAEAFRQIASLIGDKEIVFYGPNGEKFVPRTDVSQFAIQSGKVHFYVEPAKSDTEKPNYRLACENEDGRPIHPDCMNQETRCGCGK